MKKIISQKIENGFIIHQFILTNDWENYVKNCELDDEFMLWELLPYNSKTKKQEINKIYVRQHWTKWSDKKYKEL